MMGFQSVSIAIFSLCSALVVISATQPCSHSPACDKIDMGSDAEDVLSMLQAPVGAAVGGPVTEKSDVDADAADVLPIMQAPVGSAVDDPVSEKVDMGSDAADDGAHLVRLRRREARTQVGMGGTGKFFYTSRIFVGQPPQAMHVTFDTSSGQVVLPTDSCTSLACSEHWLYEPATSTYAVDINADGTLTGNSQARDAITIGFSSLDLGDGSVTGQFLADVVCLPDGLKEGQPGGCAQVGLVAATQLSDMPFRAAPFDGIIGLGMHGLSIGKHFSFLEAYATNSNNALTEEKSSSESDAAKPFKQQFALYHGMKFGEVAFGGHNPKRLASPLMWTPVAKPRDGYWQVGISSIRIGNKTISTCQKVPCRGLLDSGTSNLGVPLAAMPEFEAALASDPLRRRAGAGCIGQDLHLELSGGITLTLRAEDYASGDSCGASVSSLDLPESFAGVFILGEPLMKRYYTVFEWEEGAEQIGFGLAAAPEEGEESAVAAAEVEEDLKEARDRSWRLLGGQYTAIALMMQAFCVRVGIVMALVFLGTHLTSGKAFFAFIDKMLAHQVLKFEMSKFTVRVPAEETPEGDECVICLGSYEDDPALIAGIAGLDGPQKPDSIAEERGESQHVSGCCGGGAPRWRRLRCGHDFHETCIFEWFRKSKQCPTCRRHFIGEPGENGQAPLLSSAQQGPPISSIAAMMVH